MFPEHLLVAQRARFLDLPVNFEDPLEARHQVIGNVLSADPLFEFVEMVEVDQPFRFAAARGPTFGTQRGEIGGRAARFRRQQEPEVLPCPGVLSTPIWPPIMLTSLSLIGRPSPLPAVFPCLLSTSPSPRGS